MTAQDRAINLTYYTVFEIGQKGPRWNSYVPLVLMISVAVLLIWLAKRTKSFQWRTGIIVGGVVSALFFMSFVIGVFKSVRLQRAYQRDEYSVIEGTVEDFQPMPPEGHQEECFSVKAKRFCYSDFRGTPAFNNTTSHGGPIKKGLHVRIAYIGNDILRLQIASEGPKR